MTNMRENILEKAGLTGNEIKVYIALLELGSVSAGDVLKRTNLHRGGVYDTLDKLIEKGLVSYVIRANRKYFEAASPKNLLYVIEKREDKIKKDKEQILEIIPQLESKRKLGKEPQEVTLFKGNKGIKSIFQDWLEENKEILVVGAHPEAESLKHHMKYTLPGFHNARVKQKQVMKFIFPEKSIERARQLSKYRYTPVKILPASFFSITSIQIYGDKTAIILWSQDPIGIVIRSKEIAQSYTDYFNLLWSMGREI